MKILSVDDSRTIRRIIGRVVEGMGYEFLEAGDGREALQVLEANPETGLILLDWNMPVLDGYETLKAIRRDPQTKGIPVMMVTTESEKLRMVAALKAGATHYLVKPFSGDDLINRIRECLGIA